MSLRRFVRLVALGVALGLVVLALGLATSSEHADAGPSIARPSIARPSIARPSIASPSRDVAARDGGMPLDALVNPCSALAAAICEGRARHACPSQASCDDRLRASCDAWLARTRARIPGFLADPRDVAGCIETLTRRAQAGDEVRAYVCEGPLFDAAEAPPRAAPLGASCRSAWDCEVGARCRAGICVAGERRCTFDAACGRGRRCVGPATHACHPFASEPCIQSDDCAPYVDCVAGRCTRAPAPLGRAREGDPCDCCMGSAWECADGLTCALGVRDGVCGVPLCAEDDPFSEDYEAL